MERERRKETERLERRGGGRGAAERKVGHGERKEQKKERQ